MEAARREEARAVHGALEKLPDEQRRTIELAYFGGFSHSQIAEMLDMPIGTVKGRMRLGLEKMRAQLADGITPGELRVTGPDHARFADDAGAFLLGALADEERVAFERHMEACPDCRDEVERLRPAADALPRSVEQVDPPAGAQARRHGRRPRRGRRRGRRGRRAAACASGCARIAADPAGARRRDARRWRSLAGFGVARLAGGDDERTIAAKVDDSRLPTASAQLRVEGDGNDGAALTAEGLPDPGAGRVYQAWIATGDEIAPAPTFVADRDGSGVGRAARGPERRGRRAGHARAPRRGPRAAARCPSCASICKPAASYSPPARWRRVTAIRTARRACRCSNCGRPICPDCMTTTPVGMRCPECARQRTKTRVIRQPVRTSRRSPTS